MILFRKTNKYFRFSLSKTINVTTLRFFFYGCFQYNGIEKRLKDNIHFCMIIHPNQLHMCTFCSIYKWCKLVDFHVQNIVPTVRCRLCFLPPRHVIIRIHGIHLFFSFFFFLGLVFYLSLLFRLSSNIAPPPPSLYPLFFDYRCGTCVYFL